MTCCHLKRLNNCELQQSNEQRKYRIKMIKQEFDIKMCLDFFFSLVFRLRRITIISHVLQRRWR